MTTSADNSVRLRPRAVIVVVTLLAGMVAGCIYVKHSRWGVMSFSGSTMGTTYSVSVAIDESTPEVPDLQPKVDARLAEINRMMSTYDPESELSRFNQYTGDDWFAVSAETAEVVAYALHVAEESGGAFDPTVGPAVNLWGFGPDGPRSDLPTDEEVAAALAKIGYSAIDVRHDPPALRKSKSKLYLDLSAVAKGFAVDRVSRLLFEQSLESHMVEIGGEVRTQGTKGVNKPWRIGIEKPQDAGRSVQVVIDLEDAAIATSGDYRNFFESEGQRYSHTIDPATARPVQHSLATVTVRAKTCMQADALATALLVMGPAEGYDWAEEHQVAALFIERTGDGFQQRTTTAWKPSQPTP